MCYVPVELLLGDKKKTQLPTPSDKDKSPSPAADESGDEGLDVPDKTVSHTLYFLRKCRHLILSSKINAKNLV